MIRAVLDANVLVSAFGTRGETLTEILDRWVAGQFTIVVSEHILEEAERAWTKPYWIRRISQEEVEFVVDVIRGNATFAPMISRVEGVASHSEDDLVLSAAVNARADFLVTGDRGLLGVEHFRGVGIVTPLAFLELLKVEEFEAV